MRSAGTLFLRLRLTSWSGCVHKSVFYLQSKQRVRTQRSTKEKMSVCTITYDGIAVCAISMLITLCKVNYSSGGVALHSGCTECTLVLITCYSCGLILGVLADQKWLQIKISLSSFMKTRWVLTLHILYVWKLPSCSLQNNSPLKGDSQSSGLWRTRLDLSDVPIWASRSFNTYQSLRGSLFSESDTIGIFLCYLDLSSARILPVIRLACPSTIGRRPTAGRRFSYWISSERASPWD